MRVVFPENFCGEFEIVFEGIKAQAVDQPQGVGRQDKVETGGGGRGGGRGGGAGGGRGGGRGGRGNSIVIQRPELVEHEIDDVESRGPSRVIRRMVIVVVVAVVVGVVVGVAVLSVVSGVAVVVR